MSKKKRSKRISVAVNAGGVSKISKTHLFTQETLDRISKISDLKGVSKNLVMEMAVNELSKKVITDHITGDETVDYLYRCRCAGAPINNERRFTIKVKDVKQQNWPYEHCNKCDCLFQRVRQLKYD